MSKIKGNPRRKTRWTREFKLRALFRLDEGMSVAALAAELGVGQERLYQWRRTYRSGGVEAPREMGRPSNGSRPFAEVSAASSSDPSASARRIGELERKIGQQQLELDFFRAALRHVREQRLKQGGPGETPSTR